MWTQVHVSIVQELVDMQLKRHQQVSMTPLLVQEAGKQVCVNFVENRQLCRYAVCFSSLCSAVGFLSYPVFFNTTYLWSGKQSQAAYHIQEMLLEHMGRAR